MDYYNKEFLKSKEVFHEVMHDYPLFKETIEDIEETKIKEINELLEKNDEFYLKQAIRKLEDLIEFVKNTSNSIRNEYNKFDKFAGVWEKIKIVNATDDELKEINYKVQKANELIKSHNLKDLVEANKIMENLIKENE